MEETRTKVIPLNLSLLEVLGQGKVNEALVLQQVDYWCTINKRNDEYYIDGAYWTFSSINMMLKRDFPLCFSYDTLKRVLTNLEEGNFLITKKHKNGKLYRVNYNKISLNKNLKTDKNITKNESDNQKSRLVQNAPTKKDINKENNIYINYNTFIKNKRLSNNKGLTDKDNLYMQTKNDLFYFDGVRKDVEIAVSQVYSKVTGDYKINGVNVDVMVLQDVLKDVNGTQINYCTEQILKSKQITNFENYVIASLYNSIMRDKQNKINNQNSTLGKFNWWDE